MKTEVDVQDETNKLRWPDNSERTRIQDRKKQNAWQLSRADYRKGLILELTRLGAKRILITNGPDERLDPGVSVWFSRSKEDFSWQQTLGLESPAPTLAEIDDAFRNKSRTCHPDRGDGGDIELFKKINEARQQAKAWVTGTHNHQHEYVIAIDQYAEVRLNLCALKLTISFIRGLERVGAPAIMSQTLGAFRPKLTGGQP